jgi:hypothetical protein
MFTQKQTKHMDGNIFSKNDYGKIFIVYLR